MQCGSIIGRTHIDPKLTTDHSCCRHGCCPILCVCLRHGSLSGIQKDMQAVPSCPRGGLCQQSFFLSEQCPPLQCLPRQKHRKAKRGIRKRMIVSSNNASGWSTFMPPKSHWHLAFPCLQVPIKILSTFLRQALTCEPTLCNVNLRSKSSGRTIRSMKVVCRVNTR